MDALREGAKENKMTLDDVLDIVHEWSKKHHYKIPKAAVIQAFNEADTNNNGIVSRKELEAFI